VDYKKLFYITGAIFFILASVIAILMMAMMFGGALFD